MRRVHVKGAIVAAFLPSASRSVKAGIEGVDGRFPFEETDPQWYSQYL
jgi:hypothetical protein